MEAPLFCMVGKRPVKSLKDPETGDLYIYAYRWEDGTFEPDMSYLNKLYLGDQDETVFLTEEEFEEYVIQLENERLKESGD